eukprot:1150927-Pelagomonas_calceolata.AAC.8
MGTIRGLAGSGWARTTGGARHLRLLEAARDSGAKFKVSKGKKGKGYIAVPAYKGSLAEAKKVAVTKPVRSKGLV